MGSQSLLAERKKDTGVTKLQRGNVYRNGAMLESFFLKATFGGRM